MSARTESHFDSFHSPYSEAPNNVQSPFSGPIARSRSTSGTSFTTAKRPLHMLSDTFQSINSTKRLRRQPEEYDQQSESQVRISVTSIPNTVPPGAPVDCHQHIVDTADLLASDWRNDLYRTRPQLVMHYMDLYFTHVNSATYRMFSRDTFMDWMRSTVHKSLDELMVVYSMLAVASIFSNQDTSRSEGSAFARIARYALEKKHGHFTLQLAQSRLLLALCHFSTGDLTKAWDYCGSALSVAAGLQMNSEQGILKNTEGTPLDFGLNRHGLEECYRRTYWSAFVMDRYNRTGSGVVFSFQKEDVFLRLPCNEVCYDKQMKTDTPYFDNGNIDKQMNNAHDPQSLGFMAYLIQISTIWSDMLATIYRSKHQSPKAYLVGYAQLYDDTNLRLDSWLSSLPSSLQLTAKNASSSVIRGYADTFITIHSLYHTTGMTLNRRVRHNLLAADLIRRNLHKAVQHADGLLTMMQTLRNATTNPSSSPSRLSAPFPAYSILHAIDILSSAGSLDPPTQRDNLRTWQSGLAVVEQLASFWATAKQQRAQITRRIEAIVSGVLAAEGQGLRAWIVKSPMEAPVGGPDQDIFYTHHAGLDAGDMVRNLTALGADVKERDILYVEDASVQPASPDGGRSPKCDLGDTVRVRMLGRGGSEPRS
ncbi:hypothetical protein MMC13_002286 [Lambiella insularis]|nr:hypothetical protein [Lambiella insularis]